MGQKSFRTERDLNRVTLHRIHRIFERIRAGDYPSRRVLAQEIEVAEKTIHRDIEFMRDFLNAPIAYDPRRYGYYFDQPVGNFPLLKLTEGELFGILVAEKALEQYIGTPFEKALRNTFRKFAAGLSGELSFQWSELQEAISFKSIDVNPVDARLLHDLMMSIRRRREITFDYKKLEDKKFSPRRVQPYELVSFDRQWYLMTFDLHRKAIRTFVPSRMKNVMTTDTSFIKPRTFSASKHLQNAFGIFSGGSPKLIRIQFDRFASQLIRERHWHPSQKIRELRRARLELSLVLGSFEEIERWILSWGAHAKVIAPPELMERVKATLTKSFKQY
jgi:predicted DNA-binding transcriptional regulator YafY